MNRLLVFLFSFYLAFTPSLVFANSALGGWDIVNTVRQGASTLVNATKNVVINGSNVVKTSTAVIAPTAAQVAKMIVRTGAVLAVDLAIKELLGAVDYVMDPANNRVIYYEEPTYPESSDGQWCYFTSLNSNQCNNVTSAFSDPKTEAENYCKYWWGGGTVNQTGRNRTQDDWITYNFNCVLDSNGQTKLLNVTGKRVSTVVEEEPEQKSISYETVAEQVISDAESGDEKAGIYVNDVANDLLANDPATQTDVQQQLDTNARAETAEEATGEAKPKNPADTSQGFDMSLEFPKACEWFPTGCEAANVVINFPSKVDLWVKDLLGVGQKVETNTKEAATNTKTIADELIKEDGIPEKSQDDINLPDTPITPVPVNINWNSQCPEPVTTTISYLGQTKDIHIIRYDFICEWAWVVKASVVALASIGSVFIISGRKS